jgi:hypothetical protein
MRDDSGTGVICKRKHDNWQLMHQTFLWTRLSKFARKYCSRVPVDCISRITSLYRWVNARRTRTYQN